MGLSIVTVWITVTSPLSQSPLASWIRMHQSCLSSTTCLALMLIWRRTDDRVKLSHKLASTGTFRDSCSAPDNDKGNAWHLNVWWCTLMWNTPGITWAQHPMGIWQWKVNAVYMQTYTRAYKPPNFQPKLWLHEILGFSVYPWTARCLLHESE